MPALGLIFLSPVFAEYLSAYDNTTGRPVELLAGLLLLGPLYGCPALLIRESARRLRLGWPSILLMAAAMGVVQAGVIDQSLFNDAYRDIEYWDEGRLPTLVTALDIAPAMALGFLVGHMVWSYAAPIALIESLSRRRNTPWLRRPWLIIVCLLYLAAAWLINLDTLQSERDDASAWHWGGSLAVAIVLIAIAVRLGRSKSKPRDLSVPKPWVVAVLSFGVAFGYQALPQTWPGFTANVALLGVSAVMLLRAGRSVRWNQRHIVAVTAGPLLSLALLAFLINPFGEVSSPAKYGHNIVLLTGVAALLVWAASRARRDPIAVHDTLDVADRVEQMP